MGQKGASTPSDGDRYMELEGTWILIPARGKMHWPGCRFYRPPAPGAVAVLFEIGPGFWDGACRICDPDREWAAATTGERRFF